MLRTTLLAGLVLLVGSWLQAQARDATRRQESIVRVVLASRLGDRGVQQAERSLSALTALDFDDPVLLARKERLIDQLREEATPAVYAGRIAPLLESAFDSDEALKLAELFEHPLVQRWFETLDAREKQIRSADSSWRGWVSERFFERFRRQQ